MLQNLPYFGFSDIDFIGKKIDNVAQNDKRKKIHGFSYSKILQISSSLNSLFLKREL